MGILVREIMDYQRVVDEVDMLPALLFALAFLKVGIWTLLVG